jgi:predicted RNA binding protein YcfA (HicA-like mRNA interferase family)
VTDIPSISFRMLIKKTKQLGFEDVRQKGSHIRFVHPDGRKTTIPDHGKRDVPQGLLVKIVRYDLKMDLHEFFKDR